VCPKSYDPWGLLCKPYKSCHKSRWLTLHALIHVHTNITLRKVHHAILQSPRSHSCPHIDHTPQKLPCTLAVSTLLFTSTQTLHSKNITMHSCSLHALIHVHIYITLQKYHHANLQELITDEYENTGLKRKLTKLDLQVRAVYKKIQQLRGGAKTTPHTLIKK